MVLEVLHAVLELRPELILVHQVVVQLHLNDTESVFRIGDGLLLLDFSIRKDVLLQWLGHLFLHLLSRYTWIDGNNDTLTDDNIGELILVDVCQAIDAQSH